MMFASSLAHSLIALLFHRRISSSLHRTIAPIQQLNTRTRNRSGANKIGDFTYDITREFWGSIEMIGDSISVSGKMHGSSYKGSDVYLGELSMNESEVGYFTMIDSVASEDGVEGEKKW